MEQKKHQWCFSTVGGVKRVNLESGEDIKHLDQLDQKLWTALSCPVNGLEIDIKTLELIDKDHDGQIRVPEIIAASKWITTVLKNADDLLKQEAVFPLAAIDDSSDEGKSLLASAKVILRNLGKPDSTTLTVEETTDIEKFFSATRFNGDGIVTEDTIQKPELSILLNEIMSCVGSLKDRGGKQGLSLELLQLFIENCELYSAWYKKAEANSTILFLAEQTEEAFLSYSAIKSKVEDYFIRCRLAAFDPQSTAALNLSVTRVESISPKDLSLSLVEIAEYPLAKIEANKSLPLTIGINPAWENEIAKFKSLLVNNKESLTEPEWRLINEKFGAYTQWKSEKEGALVEPLGPNRIKEILNSPLQEELIALIEQDKALENEANSIIQLNQLVRYYRDLYTLLKNFVTFYDFYSKGHKAIFQAGTLYIDQRSCDLCLKVNDMPKHNVTASFSGMFLMYCDCVSRATNEKMTIVAALTNGDIDNLAVGRNAIFYDRKGLDWDATVVKIIDNPISIRQAFWSPYRKVSRFIEIQLNKAAAEQDNKVNTNATSNVVDAHVKLTEAPTVPKPPAQPFDIGKFVGIFAAISLALGAIGTIIASVIAGFLALVWWKMPLAFLGIIMAISGPAMIMAYFKLRKRNLAPILDANGWAINARAIVNIQFGNLLTNLAQLPVGAKINLNDPFTKKKRPFWPFAVVVAFIIAAVVYALWKNGFIHI
jgi:hypothetical protein